MSRRAVLVAVVVLQAALLYASTSALARRGALYGCGFLCGTGGQDFILPIAAGVAVAMFVLPSLIGLLCRSWQGAIVFALLPWWLAVVAHAGTLLRPYIGLGGTGGRFDPPFWVVPDKLVLLVTSLALFGALGWLGWAARHSLTELDRG